MATLPTVVYGTEKVGDLEIFYREAGDRANPTIVLLHGFPTSSFMYRNVINGLADKYHVIAPDYPGFGNSSCPSPGAFKYTFDKLADVVDQFLEQKEIFKFSIMMQDYGSPVGFRIATKHPERVQAIITQNGNAYMEGVNTDTFAPIIQYWQTQTEEIENMIIDNIFSLDGLKWQYVHGVQNPESICPDNWMLDFACIQRPELHRLNLDLFLDYQNNVALYPVWHEYLRDSKVPVLVVWGKNDAFFPEAGAHAFEQDAQDLEINLLDSGHFALEDHHNFVCEKIAAFLSARNIQ